MKTYIAIAAMLVILPIAQAASAETVPSWVKNTADWWAQGQIEDDVFVQGIQFLVAEQIINVPVTQVTEQSSEGIPAWVKNTAGWWAAGEIEDVDFINGVQHLVKIGVITVGNEVSQEKIPPQAIEQASQDSSELQTLKADLEACQEIKKAYKRIDCEKAAEEAITVYEYKRDAQLIQVGPINYYWKGMGSEGNSFETSESGQALLNIRMLAENTSSDKVGLNCTSPQICNYDVTNGSTEFKYSGMDFTSGQIMLNPGGVSEFNMLFGPNIGYGGTQFVYDPAKDYYFRITEGFGSAQIPLNLG